MKIAIASDHGGFDLKNEIQNEFTQVEWKDMGTYSTEAIDYPDIVFPLVQAILSGQVQRGVLICGTGIGVSIAANRHRGIRAALCHNEYTAQMARQHNDANILALGGRILEKKMAMEMVRIFMETSFEGDRHTRRLDKIDSYAS